jgi:hypothetical protein
MDFYPKRKPYLERNGKLYPINRKTGKARAPRQAGKDRLP